MEKVDRRVRRTRRRLRDSLIELVMAQGYDSITIQEITDHADLSRATFYLHYKDKDELLASSLEEMFDELVESVQDIIFRRSLNPDEQKPPSLPAFQHVAEYSELYKSLLGDTGVTYVIYRTIQYIARLTEKQYRMHAREQGVQETIIPIEVAAQHMAGALFSMVSWWLENDMPYTADEMAQMFHKLTVPSIRSALGKSADEVTYPEFNGNKS